MYDASYFRYVYGFQHLLTLRECRTDNVRKFCCVDDLELPHGLYLLQCLLDLELNSVIYKCIYPMCPRAKCDEAILCVHLSVCQSVPKVFQNVPNRLAKHLEASYSTLTTDHCFLGTLVYLIQVKAVPFTSIFSYFTWSVHWLHHFWICTTNHTVLQYHTRPWVHSGFTS